ncbi:MAG TPA: hypothetical protein DCY88_03345, partial [Cyanobacteria bacterium UBA11372]|nr:hypothetical protein [Cyanobacteria bacterium UBA11372]
MFNQTNESDRNSNQIGLVNRLFLSLIPIATGYAIASAPAQAATLALSDANFLLNNFSHSPTATSTKAEGYVSTNAAPGSSIVDYASAYAVFNRQNPLAYNTTLSLGIGQGNNYLGTSDSKAKVVGNFLVGTNDYFKFNFAGDLNLKTSIDTFFTESAKAAGNIYFLVLDTTNSQNIGVLDYFLLSGNLSTLGGPDYLFAQKTNRVQLNSFSQQKDFIGNQELASGSVTGSYRRYFNKPTNLTVVEVKENSTKQQAKSLFSKFNNLSGLDTSLQANTTDSMLLSGATDLSGLETSLQTVATEPIISNPIVAAMTAGTNTLNTTLSGLETSVQKVGTQTTLTDSNVAATATETSVLDTAVPTLSQNTIASAIGNATLSTQGSSDSKKISSGDMKTAIANSNTAQTWLAGKTQYTALLPDQIVKDL